MLFNLVLEYVLKSAMAFVIGVHGKHKMIGYSDDLALLGENRVEILEATRILKQEARKVALEINSDKTEYLHMKR